MFPTKQRLTRVGRFVALSRKPTGAMQFCNDWPGLFIRGDDAIFLSVEIRSLQAKIEASGDTSLINSMSQLLELAEVIERDVRVSRDEAT